MGEHSSRREFLKSLGRISLFGGALFGGAKLVRRPRASNKTCTSDGICSRCGVLSACGLPQALSAKKAAE